MVDAESHQQSYPAHHEQYSPGEYIPDKALWLANALDITDFLQLLTPHNSQQRRQEQQFYRRQQDQYSRSTRSQSPGLTDFLGQMVQNVIKPESLVHDQRKSGIVKPPSSPLSPLLDVFNIAPNAPARSAASLPDSSIGEQFRQGLGLINYIGNIRRDPLAPSSTPQRNEVNSLLGIPGLGSAFEDRVGMPNVQFLKGVPVVPGIAGSLPGADTPLVSGVSPNMFQNFMKEIPGAQDVLRSLQNVPDVDVRRLMGNWHWVLTSSSQDMQHCASSEYRKLVFNGRDASFSILDRFKDGSAQGAPKVGFGYGLKNGMKTSVYTQADPCPYEVVMVGPVSSQGQYEYVVLSNWAKYPVIGLARDVRLYNRVYRKQMDQRLRDQGYMNFMTDIMGTFHYFDWSHCIEQTPGNVVGNLLNNLFFG